MLAMFSSSKHIESIQQLLLELKNYYKLQKKFVYLDTAEKLTVLLSAVAIAVIMVLLIALVLLYATFALAFFIGNRSGIMPVRDSCSNFIPRLYIFRRAFTIPTPAIDLLTYGNRKMNRHGLRFSRRCLSRYVSRLPV